MLYDSTYIKHPIVVILIETERIVIASSWEQWLSRELAGSRKVFKMPTGAYAPAVHPHPVILFFSHCHHLRVNPCHFLYTLCSASRLSSTLSR